MQYVRVKSCLRKVWQYFWVCNKKKSPIMNHEQTIILRYHGHYHDIVIETSHHHMGLDTTKPVVDKWAATCNFKQCGVLTSVDSDEPVQPHVKLRKSKWCSVSSLTLIEYQVTSKGSDQTAHMPVAHTTLLEMSCQWLKWFRSNVNCWWMTAGLMARWLIFVWFGWRFYIPVNSYMVMSRQSVHLTTLFPGQAWLSG